MKPIEPPLYYLVRGYLPSQLGERILLAGNAGQEQVRNLQQKKQNMELELRNLELSRQVLFNIHVILKPETSFVFVGAFIFIKFFFLF